MRCDFPSLPTDWVAAFVELALQGSLPRAAGILHATELVIDLTGAGVATARPGMTRAGSGGARRGLCMISPARRPVKRNPPGAVRFVELPPLRFAGRRPLHRLIPRRARPGLTNGPQAVSRVAGPPQRLVQRRAWRTVRRFAASHPRTPSHWPNPHQCGHGRDQWLGPSCPLRIMPLPLP